MWIKIKENLYNLNNIWQIVKDKNKNIKYFYKDYYCEEGFHMVFVNIEKLNKVLKK